MERAKKMPDEEDQKQAQQNPKSNKLLIILLIVVVLSGGVGAGAYFKFFRATGESVEAKKQEEVPIYHELDTFMVNLADQGGKRFLKATIRLKVNSPQVGEECKLRCFEIRDIVLTVLTSKESEDVIKPEDKLALKKQIMETINRALQKGQVLDVYFTEFLVQ
jgi:flagellar FliL protein